MSFKIVPTIRFIKELKKLFKKYPSVKEDVARVEHLLSNNPKTGISLGNNVYKIRVNIQSKSSGKSGGGRLITYVVDKLGTIYLLSIFDKSDKETITDKELKEMIKAINL
ncbi:type II toxin-antitoxin system RelE/ParE family toxin [Ekhidna sp.]|uniref:type II toxin-antitoxin system RelE/ParE family toxin n=1 Tax=Ekhidna sp. TaxID=2608089 RepID=UPI0032EB6E4A